MRPKGMRRIGQAAVHEGVARQKVAEFVVDDRVRNRKPRQQGEPQPDSQEKDRDAGPVAVLREAETGFARAQFAPGARLPFPHPSIVRRRAEV